jgi:hypothetical protein
MSGPISKTSFMHPERHVAIIEIPVEEIADMLGLPTEIVLEDAMLDGEVLRLRLSHPIFPVKAEGEPCTILPYIKGASVGRPADKGELA